jgi:hypothetical protein
MTTTASSMDEANSMATISSPSPPLHVNDDADDRSGPLLFDDRDSASGSSAGGADTDDAASAPAWTLSPVDDLAGTMGGCALSGIGRRRPNLELSQSERSDKRLLKRHLKQRTRMRKYETRLQQAVVRRDEGLEERARREWTDYARQLQGDPESIVNYNATSSLPRQGPSSSEEEGSQRRVQAPPPSPVRPGPAAERETERVRQGRKWIIAMWQRVLPTVMQGTHRWLPVEDVECCGGMGINQGRASLLRKLQTDQARELLQNMTKGTQTESMFTNELALAGYARQKFVERAVLAFKTLDSLDPATAASSSSSSKLGSSRSDDADDPTKEGTAAISFWEKLMRVRQLWSIGCGPGCDAVGVVAFMGSHDLMLEDGILLLDFVIDQWRSAILDELTRQLSPRHVPSVETAFCDVRHPLRTDPINRPAMEGMKRFLLRAGRGDDLKMPPPCCREGVASAMIVVSYLLTETRNRWEPFFSDLLRELQGTHTLLLLSEPTAWQLHDFLQLFLDDFLHSFIWLDSSRDAPHLQSLEARLGPAVLMVCTK